MHVNFKFVMIGRRGAGSPHRSVFQGQTPGDLVRRCIHYTSWLVMPIEKLILIYLGTLKMTTLHPGISVTVLLYNVSVVLWDFQCNYLYRAKHNQSTLLPFYWIFRTPLQFLFSQALAWDWISLTQNNMIQTHLNAIWVNADRMLPDGMCPDFFSWNSRRNVPRDIVNMWVKIWWITTCCI